MLTEASKIAAGNFYRNVRGKRVYMRLASSVAAHLGLDITKVYGVTTFGHLYAFDPDHAVVRVRVKKLSDWC